MKKPLKEKVDAIVDELERLPVVSECYDRWLELQNQVDGFYKDEKRKRVRLSEQKEFRQIKNAVIPRREKKEMKTLPLDDLNAFFAEAKRSGMFELYYTEMATGLRRGELVGIKWSDINFDENSIYIQRQITRVNGVVQESPLKTANAYRQIIVPPEVTAMLREKMERENGKSVYAFSAKSGDAMCPDSMLDMLHRVLKRAGLPQVRFHDLRHTFATLALQNGVDVKTLSGLLGHYSAGFTLDTYGHITPAMKQDAANKIGGFLSGTA